MEAVSLKAQVGLVLDLIFKRRPQRHTVIFLRYVYIYLYMYAYVRINEFLICCLTQDMIHFCSVLFCLIEGERPCVVERVHERFYDW